MRVTIRGKTYETVRDAARCLKVKKDTIYTALKKDRVDRVGIGQGKGSRPNWKGGRPKRPVVIAGMHFESMASAARYIGKPRQYVAQCFNARGEESKENLRILVMQTKAKEDMAAWVARKNSEGSTDSVRSEEQKAVISAHRKRINEERSHIKTNPKK